MKQQRGFALIVTVVLLMVAAMIGLYAMRNAITQDKASANIYNKTITTNTAEHGATKFYEWVATPTSWRTTSEQGNWTSAVPANESSTTKLGSNGYFWINSADKSLISGCATDRNPCWDNTNNEVTAVVTGNLVQGTGTDRKILGTSKVRIKIGGPLGVKLPKMPGALTVAGDIGSFSGPTGNDYRMAGSSELGIATQTSTAASRINNSTSIKKNRDATHYSGGTGCPSTGACITNTDLGIWGDATALSAYIETIRTASNVTFVNDSVTGKLPACSGILIITGILTVNGKTCGGIFNGVIIVLGGRLQGNGLGGLVINGAVYVANIVTDSSGNKTFGASTIDINGGGNGKINYNNNNFTSSLTVGSNLGQYRILEWANIL